MNLHSNTHNSFILTAFNTNTSTIKIILLRGDNDLIQNLKVKFKIYDLKMIENQLNEYLVKIQSNRYHLSSIEITDLQSIEFVQNSLYSAKDLFN